MKKTAIITLVFILFISTSLITGCKLLIRAVHRTPLSGDNDPNAKIREARSLYNRNRQRENSRNGSNSG